MYCLHRTDLCFYIRTRLLDIVQKLKDRFRFSYIIPGRLAGMSRPDRGGIELLREAGIKGLLSLIETSIPLEYLEGMEYCHVPIIDFGAPDMPRIEKAVAFINSIKGPVAVHCLAGCGRTGTILAVYLVSTGLSAAASIDTVREIRPFSIETSEQENSVYEYEVFLKEKE